MADWLTTARNHLRDADPALGAIIDHRPDFDPRAWLGQLLPSMDAFGALLFQVVGQQLSVSSARAIMARLQDAYGGRLPGPREVLDAGPQQLREAGLSRRKAETLRELARRFVAGDFSDASFARSSDEEIENALTAIPGIGPWTVRGFLIIFLGRPDVLPVGDLALRRALKRIYDLDQLPDEKEFQQIAERWRPYRTLAVMYLFEAEYEQGNVHQGQAGVTPLSAATIHR
jgi:DNA-3-methyladenine glycosylase II